MKKLITLILIFLPMLIFSQQQEFNYGPPTYEEEITSSLENGNLVNIDDIFITLRMYHNKMFMVQFKNVEIHDRHLYVSIKGNLPNGAKVNHCGNNMFTVSVNNNASLSPTEVSNFINYCLKQYKYVNYDGEERKEGLTSLPYLLK
jgi:hypothetical protein